MDCSVADEESAEPMAPSCSSERELVWVKEGKTQHAAFVLSDPSSSSSSNTTVSTPQNTNRRNESAVLIEWASTKKQEWVSRETIKWSLMPRKKRRREEMNGSMEAEQEHGQHFLKQACRTALATSQPNQRAKEGPSRVSLLNSPSTPMERSSNPASLTRTMEAPCSQKVDSSNDNRDDDADDDDDEIEFLWTLAPTPPRRSSRRQEEQKCAARSKTMPSTGSGEESKPNNWTSSNTSRNEPTLAAQADSSSPTLASDRHSSSSTVETPSLRAVNMTQSQQQTLEPVVHPEDPPSYRNTDSAYVQTLAEICHAILKDARWRVGGLDQKPLFQWEVGDDLSAIVALSRVYRAPSHQQEPIRRSCACLLCFDNGDTVSLKHAPVATHRVNPIETDDGAIIESRASSSLHLFCRLFHRRGPWFRLDDIYERYYKPADTKLAMEETNNTATRNNTKKPVRYDPSLLPNYMNRFNEMLQDLLYLSASGLFRSFEGEEECGLTVGRSVLTQDVRVALLAKLGATKAKKQPIKKPLTTDERTGKKHRRRRFDDTNLVWQQMNRQQSLSFFGIGDNKNGKTQGRQLLPVIKHVDGLLVGKLSVDILKCCCGISGNDNMTHLPAAIRKAHLPTIQQQLLHIVKRHLLSTQQSGVGTRLSAVSNFTCWRLREEPTVVLRRCCRLYLCATAGPGEMRSSETNGFKTVLINPDGHHNRRLPLANRVRPPFVASWSQVTFDGSMVRFGLSSALFQSAYQPIPVSNRDGDSNQLSQIFWSAPSFQAWELCVELRANVDYLIELHELLRYEKRQKKRRRNYDSESEDSDDDDDDEHGTASVDFMKILTAEGVRSIISTFVKTFPPCSDQGRVLGERIVGKIESVLSACEELTESERIVISLAICSIYILDARSQFIEKAEASRMVSRPSLRHLWWEGCLAYIVWDCIPIIERRELYSLAIEALHVLLYGCVAIGDNQSLGMGDRNPLAPLLLSRRARGKALDRLVIDQTHLNRRRISQMEVDTAPSKTGETKSSKKQQLQLKKKASIEAASEVSSFSERVLHQVVRSSMIAFSSIRGLARRLKRPLPNVLRNVFCLEAQELGLRLENDSKTELEKARESENKGYSDWTPITDKAIANALDNEKEGAGSRCIFVGNDSSPSINVEQLAMECYEEGSLPASDMVSGDSAVVGGWVGWHDEGGYVRAIFRVLSSAPLLGVDWGCSSSLAPGDETLFCSPYQGAPFDLHVGFGLNTEIDDSSAIAHSAIPGFYVRQRQKIERFLNQLTETNPQGLCDAIFRAIEARLIFGLDNNRKDPSLERDLKNLRTLSFIAAGLGGQLLASVFRCMVFDYRHYSGGLPDLLLVRATAIKGGNREVVDLSSIIGESFSAEYQQEKLDIRGAKMLADEEFLGCSKVGDSGNSGSRSNNWARSARSPQGKRDPKPPLSLSDLPQKLELEVNGEPIEPECMMVEVKSSNDRLDPRQEDWLNILDRHGNARVCKFEDKRKSSKRKLAEAAVS